MRVKTFEFIVNCFCGNFSKPLLRQTSIDSWQQKHQVEPENKRRLELIKEICTKPEDMDVTINDYIKDKKVVNILENYYTKDRHNNGMEDTIVRVVTIITE